MNGKCDWCNVPLKQQLNGRPKEHCSHAHKQAAYRWRKGEEARRESRRTAAEQSARQAFRAILDLEHACGDNRIERAKWLIEDFIADFVSDPWATWPEGYADPPRKTSPADGPDPRYETQEEEEEIA